LNQRNKRAAKIGELSAATVHNGSRGDDLAAVVADDLDCFLHAASACDDILGYKETLARVDFKTSAQDESAASVLFGEDVYLAEVAGDFLADNNATDSRGDDGVGIEPFQFFGEQTADARGHGGILQEKGTLEELAAVQSASQHEMAVQ